MWGCGMMTEREFLVEICNRAISAHAALLKVQCELLRLEADKRCLELTIKSLERQIELMKYRDSLQTAA
jgi:hypothetical protein